MSSSLADRVADLALNTFSSLPQKCKPRTPADGRREWTPMSAVVINIVPESTGVAKSNNHEPELDQVQVVSLATGTKSLSLSALPKCDGLVLHDCHAEILALRGFNYWLLCEIELILQDESYMSPWLENTRGHPPFRLRSGVELSLFTTEAPCGDASMDILMKSAEAAGRDVTPWLTRSSSSSTASLEASQPPPGRGFFSDLGALRRKPARADAEVSMSKSCTDKLMLKQFTSLLGFPTDMLIHSSQQAFLKRLVIYMDQHSEEGYTRAFAATGRLKNFSYQSPPIFFEVTPLSPDCRRFDFEKERQGGKGKVSNISALWVHGPGENGRPVVEALVNGVKQGFKQFDDRVQKGSVVCRRNMIRKACALQDMQQGNMVYDLADGPFSCYYSDVKSRTSHQSKQSLKRLVLEHLGGWPRNHTKDDFETCFPAL